MQRDCEVVHSVYAITGLPRAPPVGPWRGVHPSRSSHRLAAWQFVLDLAPFLFHIQSPGWLMDHLVDHSTLLL
jgi:hypothetical protein